VMPSVPCSVCGQYRGIVKPDRYFDGYLRICYVCKQKEEVRKKYQCKSLTSGGKRRCKQLRTQRSVYCVNHIKHNIPIEEEE